MTMSDDDVVVALVLGYPFIVLAMALLVVWLTGWQDARDDRRNAQRRVYDSTVG